MASIKGICKSFKCLTHIFVVKEREIEIGYPTDVKHVTHIGWDGTSGSPPSWMSEFKSGPQFSGLSLGRGGETRDKQSMDITSWSSQDFDEKSMRGSQAESTPKNLQPPDLPNIPKKHKRRKSKVTSSPTSASSKPGKSKASKDKKSILDVI